MNYKIQKSHSDLSSGWPNLHFKRTQLSLLTYYNDHGICKYISVFPITHAMGRGLLVNKMQCQWCWVQHLHAYIQNAVLL